MNAETAVIILALIDRLIEMKAAELAAEHEAREATEDAAALSKAEELPRDNAPRALTLTVIETFFAEDDNETANEA
jgi:hypothetical protein